MTDRARTPAVRSSAALGACVAVALLTISARADAPAGRFVVSQGTVFDTVTQLLWQEAPTAPSDFLAAVKQCQGLSLAGKTGWRLPTMAELHTLVDERRAAPAMDPSFAPSAEMVWSKTPYAGGTSVVWGMDFASGHTILRTDTDLGAVRCVR
jgi:hypothetical protein